MDGSGGGGDTEKPQPYDRHFHQGHRRPQGMQGDESDGTRPRSATATARDAFASPTCRNTVSIRLRPHSSRAPLDISLGKRSRRQEWSGPSQQCTNPSSAAPWCVALRRTSDHAFTDRAYPSHGRPYPNIESDDGGRRCPQRPVDSISTRLRLDELRTHLPADGKPPNATQNTRPRRSPTSSSSIPSNRRRAMRDVENAARVAPDAVDRRSRLFAIHILPQSDVSKPLDDDGDEALTPQRARLAQRPPTTTIYASDRGTGEGGQRFGSLMRDPRSSQCRARRGRVDGKDIVDERVEDGYGLPLFEMPVSWRTWLVGEGLVRGRGGARAPVDVGGVGERRYARGKSASPLTSTRTAHVPYAQASGIGDGLGTTKSPGRMRRTAVWSSRDEILGGSSAE